MAAGRKAGISGRVDSSPANVGGDTDHRVCVEGKQNYGDWGLFSRPAVLSRRVLGWRGVLKLL